jgi:predicted lipid-binding transport protein (Tim44 family)
VALHIVVNFLRTFDMTKRIPSLMLVALAAIALIATDVDARGMGGGRSFGAQRSVRPQPAKPAPQQAPTNAAQAQPTQPGAPAAAPTPKPQTPPASGLSRWLGPLAGIAAGLGLAALLSNLGLSGDFAGVLVAILLIAGVVLLARRFLARPAIQSAPLQYAGEGPGEPKLAYELPPAAVGGAPMVDRPTVTLPAGFDAERFLKQARASFGQMQAAFDANDRKTLADMMTPEMYHEVARDLDQGRDHRATEVVKLDADVVEVATEGDRHWASVRFSGLLRDGEPQPHEFDEIWNLTKPVDDSHGWLLAGIQQVREVVQ